MIAQLKGQVEQIGSDALLIDVQGVGYEVHCSTRTLAHLRLGQAARLSILTHVREDHIHLYGFGDEVEKGWFDLLLAVQGVGPKMALAILSQMDATDLTNALLLADKRPFQSVSGVGPKLAARLVTELKERSPKAGFGQAGRATATAASAAMPEVSAAALLRDLTSALTNLGYDEARARTAATAAIQEVGVQEAGDQASLDVLIPLALKAIS